MITGSRSRRGGWSAALNKVEHYGVQRVTGDGRCMFRALVSRRNFCSCGILHVGNDWNKFLFQSWFGSL
jgi:hypothetical protein